MENEFARLQREAGAQPPRILKVPGLDPAAVARLLERFPFPAGTAASVETDPLVDEAIRSRVGSLARLSLGSGGTLPAPDLSLDSLFTCHVLEGLRMDELYMLCSEARRVVKAGGHWALLAHHPGEGWLSRLLAKRDGARSGRRPLEIIHYISPEDWDTLLDKKIPRRGRLSQAVILKRRHG